MKQPLARPRSFLPCAELRDLLLPLYKCENFTSNCKTKMRWTSEGGHVPRGFCGALGLSSPKRPSGRLLL